MTTAALAHRGVTYPLDALVSFHYYAADQRMTPLVETGRLRLIGDSGAYSALTSGAAVRIPDYAAWLHRWREHLLWAASVDVIGDPVASWRHWRELRDTHQLDTVPTLHAGADVFWLDRYAAAGATLVGLGGMAGKGQAQRAYPWAARMLEHAAIHHPGLRFHLWGVASSRYLESLPVWSADSSGIIGMGYRYGKIRVFDPQTERNQTVLLRGDGAVYRHAALLRDVYGIDPAHIDRADASNRTTLIRLAAVSTQHYARWLQLRHRVEPPALLADSGVTAGPRLHLVSSVRGRVDLVTAVTD